jgi:hypothetical protein
MLPHAAVRVAALHGGTDVMGYHAGSPLLLLVVLQVCNPALWTLLYSLHSRLVVRWSRLGLPALAVLPLWQSGRVCRRLMQAPGTLEPLARLHHLLSLAQ